MCSRVWTLPPLAKSWASAAFREDHIQDLQSSATRTSFWKPGKFAEVNPAPEPPGELHAENLRHASGSSDKSTLSVGIRTGLNPVGEKKVAVGGSGFHLVRKYRRQIAVLSAHRPWFKAAGQGANVGEFRFLSRPGQDHLSCRTQGGL
jgi:hypothetical protein